MRAKIRVRFGQLSDFKCDLSNLDSELNNGQTGELVFNDFFRFILVRLWSEIEALSESSAA